MRWYEERDRRQQRERSRVGRSVQQLFRSKNYPTRGRYLYGARHQRRYGVTMTSTAKGFRGSTLLTVEEARTLTDSIKVDLSSAYIGIVKAYRGRAWQALGYTSFGEYCKTEFHGARMVRLSDDQLAEIVRVLSDEGLPYRAIGAATGYSVGKVFKHRPEDVPEYKIGADGKRRKARQHLTVVTCDETAEVLGEPEPIVTAKMSQSDWAALMVIESGVRGLTYKELNHTADGWTHAQSSAALSRAARRKQIEPTEMFRDGCTVYVAAHIITVV
jgi:hypothetical protein